MTLSVAGVELREFQKLRPEERRVAYRLIDAARDCDLGLTSLEATASVPDLRAVIAGRRIGLELTRLHDLEISRTNKWLEEVQTDLEELTQAAEMRGDLGYELLRMATVSAKERRRSLQKSLQTLRSAHRTEPDLFHQAEVVSKAQPWLRLTWQPMERTQVFPNAVRQLLPHDPRDLLEFLCKPLRRKEAKYSRQGADADPWWLVVHDEGEVLSEPLFSPDFTAFVQSREPLESILFERLLVLGSVGRTNGEVGLLNVRLSGPR